MSDVVALVQTCFSDHPGDATEFWWPTTREGALEWLEDFLKVRFAEFGPFEDAISTRSRTVFHSVLSPLMNLGLLTPDEVVSRAVEYAEQAEVPLQSVEGFVRQIIGWREFIRGVYQNLMISSRQTTSTISENSPMIGTEERQAYRRSMTRSAPPWNWLDPPYSPPHGGGQSDDACRDPSTAPGAGSWKCTSTLGVGHGAERFRHGACS